MSGPAFAACLWVIAAAATALLPMRAQMLPGLALLIAAPGLVVWIGAVHGWLWTVPAVLAFVSMFRRPLAYLLHRLTGWPPLRPQGPEGRA